MALDFLIFGLLLISFAINLLALGAFCVTPGLRTTGNRFVINLLITNLFGCCILTPTLFSNGNVSDTVPSFIDNLDIFSPVSAADFNRLSVLRNRVMEESVNEVIVNGSKFSETIFVCNLTFCEQLTFEKRVDKIVLITHDGEKIVNNVIVNPSVPTRDMYRKVEFSPTIRYWSMDLAAALGSLSVLLIVGDTWIAVRDPLRYHNRISECRAFVLIIMTWIVGILFGVMSAFGEINECTVLLGKIQRLVPSGEIMELSITPRTIFSMIFACTYFILIILMPFGFVCRMYWRIFSEAKENGIRIRKNRSSTLLQNAHNLSYIHQQGNSHLFVQRNFVSGASSNGGRHAQSNQKTSQGEYRKKIAEDEKQKGQITLTPLTALLPPISIPNIEIKRNYSIRQLPLLHQFPQDLKASERLNGFRQTHSAPNLQKYNGVLQNSSPFLDTTIPCCYIPEQALLIPTIYASSRNLNCMESIRQQILNASSIFKRREESRAARISILVVLMFLVSYLPYGLLVLLQGRLIKNFSQSMQLTVFMILLANVSSPFIFAFRNKHVRRGVCRIFGLDARSREHRLLKQGILLPTKESISVNRISCKIPAYSISSSKFLNSIVKTKTKIKFNKHETNLFQNAVDVNCSQDSPIQSRTIAEDDKALTIQSLGEDGKCLILKICKSSPNLRCTLQSHIDFDGIFHIK